MPYLGAYAIDDFLTFAVNTHNNKGQARDADSVPTYRVYEDETATPLLTGDMALLDGSNTVGFYSERIQLTAANGFELDKVYNIYITATVQGIQGTISHIFQMPTVAASSFNPLTDTVIVSSGTVTSVINPVSFSGSISVTGTVSADVISISGDTTAADNLELQFDGTGLTGDTYPATQSQVNNIAITGAPSYEAPTSYVLSTGTQTAGTYQNVDTSNAVYHTHTDSGGQLSLYYEYTLAGDEIGVEMLFKGRVNGINDSVNIQAYDWTTGSYSTLYTLAGTVGTTDTITSAPLVSKYTGTGANIGKVRIRIVNAVSLTTATLYVDQLIIGKTITSRTVGYADGAVWLDTSLSNTNTASFIDGVADNPVSTLAAARIIASALGLKRIHVSNGSSITLASNSDNLEFLGEGWTLALGGQSIAGTYFEGATVSGTGTGATAPMFKSCLLGTVTLPASILWNCLLTSNTSGGFTCSGTGDYFFYACASGIAGTNRPSITFFSGDCNVNLRNYSGGITLLSMVSGCDCSVEGRGNCVIDASCTGGTVVIRGLFTLTNNGTGMSVTDTARFAEDQNIYAITNGWVRSSGTVSTTVTGYVTVTGTVDANIVSSNNIDFTALQKTSLNASTPLAIQGGYVTVSGTVTATVPGTVIASAVQGGYVTVTGSVVASSVTNPVTVGTNNDKTGYTLADNSQVFVTGTVSSTLSGYVMVTGTVVVGTNNDKTDYVLSSAGVTAITNDVFSEAVEGTLTFRQWVRRVAAVLFGKSSGGGAVGSKKFRDMADTLDRVDATTDANGNRTGTTFDDS